MNRKSKFLTIYEIFKLLVFTFQFLKLRVVSLKLQITKLVEFMSLLWLDIFLLLEEWTLEVTSV